MKITEINDIILGNVELPKSKINNISEDYSDKIKEAIELCDGLYDKNHINQTFSHNEFYDANPMMYCFIKDWYKEGNVQVFMKELFYSMLCGLYVPGVPSELTALFVLTRRQVETPNKMIAALDKSRLKRYLCSPISDNPRIMKELLDTIWGYDVQLVTSLRPSVTNKGVVEVYIDNINDVLLCDESIKDILTDVRDFKDLWYSKDKGVVLGDKEIPLRTLIHSFGIVDDDLDLRKVYYKQ